MVVAGDQVEGLYFDPGDAGEVVDAPPLSRSVKTSPMRSLMSRVSSPAVWVLVP